MADDRSVLQETTITVYNRASFTASFLLIPTPPIFLQPSKPETVRTCVYQACGLLAPETGSHTFVIPAGLGSSAPPPIMYAVTGCDRVEPVTDGVRLYDSDVAVLGPGSGATYVSSSCIMTMPEGYEPGFKKNDGTGRAVAVAGDGSAFRIDVDTSFRVQESYDKNPFVGFGAPDPYNSQETIPLCTWKAKPGKMYLFKPDYQNWVLMPGSGRKGGLVNVSQKMWYGLPISISGERGGNIDIIFRDDGTLVITQWSKSRSSKGVF